jgi:predicted transposase
LKKKKPEAFTIQKAELSEDGKKVTLLIPEFKEATNMIIKYKIKGKDGTDVKNEINNTVHKLLD